MTTTIKEISNMLLAFVLCAGLVITSCETADPENSENPENPGTPEIPANIIIFDDDIVKKSCVEVFDTDCDGEVSYDEAAAVKYLSHVSLRFVDEFLTFDEFQYFINVKSIPDNFFNGGKYLKSIAFPEGLEIIGERAFNGCTSLAEVELPEGLETIGESAFSGCTSLKEVEFPERLETIGGRAFSGCTSLAEVELPEGLESIGSQFDHCVKLKKIKFSRGLRTVDQFAFAECRNLKEVHFPNGLLGIWTSAFQDSDLDRMYCASTTPPSLFTYLKCKTVYVPHESVESYKNASGWKDYDIYGYDF